MRTRTTTAALIAAGLLVTLTACGSSNSADGDGKASPAAPAAAPETPTEEPTPTMAPPMALGDVYEWEDTTNGIEGSSAVLSYKQGVKSVGTADEEVGAAGYEWAALELKVCSAKGTFSTSSSPWALSYDDGARAEASSSIYEDFPRPQYPVETTLTTGKCVRGYVVYPVPDDDRPSTVVYMPGSASEPVEWALPLK